MRSKWGLGKRVKVITAFEMHILILIFKNEMVEINKHFYCSLHMDVAKKKGGGQREREREREREVEEEEKKE